MLYDDCGRPDLSANIITLPIYFEENPTSFTQWLNHQEWFGIAEIKSRLSDYVSKSRYNKERFVIAKRNQPAAALVSSEDLLKIEKFDNVGGLSETIGKWDCFDEISESLKEITLLRNQGGDGRNVSI